MKHESINQPGLYYWAEPNEIDGGRTFCVVCQMNGYPATAAFSEWLSTFEAADEIARDLAQIEL